MNRGSITRDETAVIGAGVSADLARSATAAADGLYRAFDAHSTGDRVEILAAVCADDVFYANPLQDAVGIHALAELLTELAQLYPGHTAGRTSGVDAHHGTLRYHWSLRDGVGRTVVAGMDVVRFTAKAQLAWVVSFFGPPPAINYNYRM